MHTIRMLAVVLVLSGISTLGQGQSSVTAAPVPNLVNFAGTLKSPAGHPVPPVAGVTFSLYALEEGGVPLWLETQTVHVDGKGNYTVQLGATKAEGLPLELFTSGTARWLGVRMNGGDEQPRVLLVSVPYALKAADSQTLGGLPPSAFMLAAPANAVGSSNPPASAAAAVPPPAGVTGSGTANYLPLWTGTTALGNSAIFQTGSGSTARIGINTSTPTAVLDVKGAATFRGAINMSATGVATASAGKVSQASNFVASTFNSASKTAVNETFHWRAEPVGNNTSGPGASMNLLFAQGTAIPVETGFAIASNGLVSFASGQTFPGAGTVSSVALGAPPSDFTITGSPVTTGGTLGLNWKIAPTSANVANTIVKRDASGNFSASVVQAVALSVSNPTGAAVFGVSGGSSGGSDGVHGETASATGSGVAGVNQNGGVGVYGASSGLAVYGTSSGSQAIWGESSGTTFTNGSGPDGVHGVAHSNAGAGVGGLNTAAGGVGVWGEAPSGVGFYTPNNVQQARSAGGWVKAMVYVNAATPPYNIVRCFNSNLVGAAATTPPCGINFTEYAFGNWLLDFGFQVNDRFYSATLGENYTGGHIQVRASTKNQLEVYVMDDGFSNGEPAEFSLIVF